MESPEQERNTVARVAEECSGRIGVFKEECCINTSNTHIRRKQEKEREQYWKKEKKSRHGVLDKLTAVSLLPPPLSSKNGGVRKGPTL